MWPRLDWGGDLLYSLAPIVKTVRCPSRVGIKNNGGEIWRALSDLGGRYELSLGKTLSNQPSRSTG